MNKQVKRYFDWKFENGELASKPYDGNNEWFGVWIDDFLVVGYPPDDYSGIWFSNGPYFEGGGDLLGLFIPEFNELMRDYLILKYPNIKIDEVY